MPDNPTGGVPEETTLGGATREMARERAKIIREQHRRQERRRRGIVISSIVVGLVVIVAVVGFVIFGTIKPAGPGPLNMLSDGVLIGKGAAVTSTSAIPAKGEPVATVPGSDPNVVAITTYIDYLSPESGEFDRANAAQLKVWLDSGAATLEVHPISMLNSRSQGTQYSTRAANAAGCVANFDPGAFLAYNTALFADQPDQSTGGLTDAQLLRRATHAGVTQVSRIRSCIHDLEFAAWVSDASGRALAGPLPNSKVKAVVTTPTVLVNGAQYTGAPGDDEAFAAFVLQAAGSQFNNETDPSATPTAAPATTAPAAPSATSAP